MLNREPMGMKPARDLSPRIDIAVSVLNREPMGMKQQQHLVKRGLAFVSVLNREPMGMKRQQAQEAALVTSGFSAQPRADGDEALIRRRLFSIHLRFSAQPRADGDEARHLVSDNRQFIEFQCSTASRWG